MRKRLSLLLILCIVLTLSPMEALAAGTEADDAPVLSDGEKLMDFPALYASSEWVAYPVTGGNLYFYPSLGRITGCDASVTSADIPSSINDVTVTSIGGMAFSGCNVLESVTIPDSVTSIGDSAFSGCSALASVTVPGSVTSIGGWAFGDCPGLTSAGPIGGGYCYEFGWTDAIPANAFKACSSLAHITVPRSIASIGDDAFFNCISLSNVVLPDGLLSIGSNAFSACNNLRKIAIPNSVTTIGDGAFFNCNGLTSITIPHSVINIGSRAFSACGGLTSVVISDGITTIGTEVFSNCGNLSSITIPSSVTSIGSNAFSSCGSLTNISVAESNPKYSSSDGVLMDKGQTALICYPAGKDEPSYIIPDGMANIGDYAFSGCAKLTDITIPSSVHSVGNSAFWGCTGLMDITLPAGITSIGNSAFSGCSRLVSITIPCSVTNIGSGLFHECSSLAEIYFEGTETQWNTIYRDYNGELSNVMIHFSESSDLPPDVLGSGTCGANLVWTLDKSGTLTISGTGPMDNYGGYYYDYNYGYYNSAPWLSIGRSITSVRIEDGVASIGRSAFQGCNLVDVAVSDSITSIGDYAFSGCRELTGIIIPDGVTAIGDSAFSSCTKLTSMTIPGSVTTIGKGAFSSCSNLIDIFVAEENPRYRSNSGVLLNKEQTVLICYPSGKTDAAYAIPNSIAIIADSAFNSNSALTSLTIPGSVISIGSAAFQNCGSLTDIYYTGTQAQWSDIYISGSNTLPANATIHFSGPVDSFTVTFDPNGGGGSMRSEFVAPGTTYVLPGSGFTAPESKRFKAWSIHGTNYMPGTSFPVTGNITVAAVWVDAYSTVDIPLSLTAKYYKGSKTAVVSVVTAEPVTLSNYDVTLSWDENMFTIAEIANGQTSKITGFQANASTGKIAAMSGGSNVTIGANEVLATYTLSTPGIVETENYRFLLTIQGASCESEDELSWKGEHLSAELAVPALSGASFDNKTNSAALINFEDPVEGDFSVTSEQPCVLIYSDGSSYHRLTAKQVSGAESTYAFSLPRDYDNSCQIIIALCADFNMDGDINSTDAIQVLRCAAGLRDCDSVNILISDINGEGELTSTDALQILRLCVGLRTVSW